MLLLGMSGEHPGSLEQGMIPPLPSTKGCLPASHRSYLEGKISVIHLDQDHDLLSLSSQSINFQPKLTQVYSREGNNLQVLAVPSS